ncbi:hypothetical protein C0992_002769 [Termitomyces sp. T32_za158]|nr:hypothetical protein C0992_002769 [Termitomyces sp. T32_za158]
MTPDQVKEEESVVILAGMMGVDNDQARRVLRKYKGDVEKAADAMLSGDQGDELPPLWQPSSESSQDPDYVDSFRETAHTVAQPPSLNVIDLTGDDNDRTLKLSQAQNDIKFGPSERAPDPGWQVVATNTPIDNSDDRAMNEAIQASLADFGSSEELEILPMEESVREGGRPIALRTYASEITYAALIIQAFAQIPQIRRKIATLLESAEESLHRPARSPELVELFANLDLAQLSSILDKDVLPFMKPFSWDGSNASLGYGSADFIKHFAEAIDNTPTSPDELPLRLFHFTHARAECRGSSSKLYESTEQNGCVVEIQTGDPATPNDLLSRLSSNLFRAHNEVTRTTTCDVIVHPSEVVVFYLKPMQSSGQTKTPEPFAFPKQFYLDRFILEKLPLTEEKKTQELKLCEQMNELVKRRQLLTRGDQGRDVLTDLRASLHYFEEVACKDTPERVESVNRTATKLRALLDSITSTVREMEVAAEKLQYDLASIYDVPELQNHLYDLRAVFMHTGMPGRKQIYSYIRDGHGVWWKTVDHTVTEVPEETALTDPTGLHLGAGPYLLLYNRHLSDEEMLAPVAWPRSIADSIEDSNKKLFALLHHEAEEKVNAQKATVPLAAAPTVLMSSLSSASLSDRDATQVLQDVEMQTQQG